MTVFLDALVYTLLSFCHVWMILAALMLLVRRRKFRAFPRSPERQLYRAVIAVSLVVWVWNGVRPTPVLFQERVGLYWGIKTQNAGWSITTEGYRGQPAIAHRGQSSMAVTFHKSAGWVIFHHFPTAPPVDRYAAVEFHCLAKDLRHDPLLLAIYSDGKLRHPAGGLKLEERHRCPGGGPDGWICYRVRLDELGHPGGGLVGLAFGKGQGVDEGTFFLDDVVLIPARAPSVQRQHAHGRLVGPPQAVG